MTEARLTAYEPTLREVIAQWLMGDSRPSPARERFVSGLMGTRGLGDRSMSLADLTPAGVGFSAEDAARDYQSGDYVGAGLNTLGTLPAVGWVGTAAKNAVPAAKTMASSRFVGYNPPVRPPRPFDADYPAGALADGAGKLTHTIDGTPITAKYVVGRNEVGGSDVALPNSVFDEIATATTGSPILAVPQRDLGRDLGNVSVNRFSRMPILARVSTALKGDQFGRVAAHETGHLIDQASGEIGVKGLSAELADNYNRLNNITRNYYATDVLETAKKVGPQHFGYKDEYIPRENIAEAIRAYMADPNYIKTVAPKTAAAVRKAVNANPKLSGLVQFNSVAPLAGAGIGGAAFMGAGQGGNEAMAAEPTRSEWDAFPLADHGASEWDAFPLAENTPSRQEQGPAMPRVGMGEAIGRGAVQGATLGFGDEIKAASDVSAPMAAVRQVEQDTGRKVRVSPLGAAISAAVGGLQMLAEKINPDRFGTKTMQAYDAAVGTERAANAMAEDQRPYSSFAGTMAGGLALPVGPITSIAQGVKLGAGLGAVGGFGSGEGLEGSLRNAGIGAALGSGLGAVGGKLASGKPMPPAPPPISGTAVAAENMGVGLTAGQKTGNAALLSREDMAFGGALGERAQIAAQDARAMQTEQLSQAGQNIGKAIGGDVPANPNEAAALVQSAIQTKAKDAKAGAQALYDQAYSTPGEFSAKTFEGMPGRIADALVSRQSPIVPDKTLTPASAKMLDELSRVGNLSLGKIGQPGAGDVVAGINMAGLDRARRIITSVARSAARGSEDERAARAIIGEFDSVVASAIDDGLFSGSQDALKSLIGARKSYSQYRQTFKPGPGGDDAGKAIQSIIERNATPQETANFLYGGSMMGDGRSVRVAQKMKEIFGEGSEELNAIRRGVWQKLSETTEGKDAFGPKTLANRIYEFANGRGGSLASELFSASEMKMMTDYADVLMQVAQKAGTVNNSQSGNRLAALAQRFANELGASVGATVGSLAGGPVGAVAGAGVGTAASAGIKTLAGSKAARETASLMAGEIPVRSFTIGERLSSAMAGVGGKATRLTGQASEAAPLQLTGPRVSYGETDQKEKNARK